MPGSAQTFEPGQLRLAASVGFGHGAERRATEAPISTVVWGTGNMGRAAIRAVDAHPGLELSAVIVANPDKVGRDAGELAGLDRTLGVAATDDVDAVLAASPGAVAYMASGDIRPDDAVADVSGPRRRRRRRHAGAYSLYDPPSAPPELREPAEAAAKSGRRALRLRHRPGLGQRPPARPRQRPGRHDRPDPLPGDLQLRHLRPARRRPLPRRHGPAHGLRAADGGADRPHHGLGRPDPAHRPARSASSSTRSARRSNGVRSRTPSRTPWASSTQGTQGALRFEVQGIVDGEPRIVVEHITRIHAALRAGLAVARRRRATARTR